MTVLCLKVDVDTARGTQIGVPQLIKLFQKYNINATILFSLGPDNTGRALKRIFRPGFLKKVSRTSVVSTYGIRTLLNGVLLPGPHIAKKFKNIMLATKDAGFEVGIHCYDHIRWQDGLAKMSKPEVFAEFNKALTCFSDVFATPAQTAGTAGWQANAFSLAAYDNANLLYGSDCRGTTPFYPKIGHETFKTLQIPTTLPTLDELLGRPEFPEESLIDYYHSLLSPTLPNIFTMHAEIEGMRRLNWFTKFIESCLAKGIIFKAMRDVAQDYQAPHKQIPTCEFIQGTMEGRSGFLAQQGKVIA